MGKSLGLIGAPTSAGAFAPGRRKPPQALRDAGILGRLTDACLTVFDHGDGPTKRWRPDKQNRSAQTLDAEIEVTQETAARVRRAVEANHVPLVLGGDCTLELATVAGHLSANERIGLVYFDVHPDLNVPSSVRAGALDWMGVAHMLGEEKAAEPLSRVEPRFPLLNPGDLFFFSYGPGQATPWEREVLERRNLRSIPVDEVAADPEGTAAAALAELEPRFDKLLVHFDVDTVDFTDVPLSENTGRNEGLAFDQALRALRVLVGSQHFGALTVTELNPDHGEEDGATIELFVEALVGALARSPALVGSTPTD